MKVANVKPVTKAVFPVGGLGTRFLPATKATPKEMLPVVDKPLVQYAVEEAYAAGVRQMIFVTGRNKRSIEDHFDVAAELEAELEACGKHALRRLLDDITPPDMTCMYVRQPRPLGLVEKPAPEHAPSTLAVAGRYILGPSVFTHLTRQQRGAGGEIQLTDAIAAAIGAEPVFALRYQGTRYDCGSKLGFLQATVVLGQQHPEVGSEFTNWLGKR